MTRLTAIGWVYTQDCDPEFGPCCGHRGPGEQHQNEDFQEGVMKTILEKHGLPELLTLSNRVSRP
jgi:hypothetical protein